MEAENKSQEQIRKRNLSDQFNTNETEIQNLEQKLQDKIYSELNELDQNQSKLNKKEEEKLDLSDKMALFDKMMQEQPKSQKQKRRLSPQNEISQNTVNQSQKIVDNIMNLLEQEKIENEQQKQLQQQQQQVSKQKQSNTLNDANQLINLIEKDSKKQEEPKANNNTLKDVNNLIAMFEKEEKTDINNSSSQTKTIIKKSRPLSPQGDIKNPEKQDKFVENLLNQFSQDKKKEEEQKKQNFKPQKEQDKKQSNLDRFNKFLEENKTKSNSNQLPGRTFSPTMGNEQSFQNSNAMKLVETIQNLIDQDEQKQ